MLRLLTPILGRRSDVCKEGSSDSTVKVWDEPTRLFHWFIVVLIAVSWISADLGYMKVHLWSGSALLCLLIFRLIWGFFGSTTSRFSDFLRPPQHVIGYFRDLLGAEKPRYAGHNPAGGWMVLTMVLVVLVQVVTGLFSNDGIGFTGPLALRISSDVSDEITQIHGWIFFGILTFVWLHLVAIFFYYFVKRENLIQPMVTGHKHRVHLPAIVDLKFTHPYVALAIFAAVTAAVLLFLFVPY
jgi:cytochrome b